jgi:hypothetical protein
MYYKQLVDEAIKKLQETLVKNNRPSQLFWSHFDNEMEVVPLFYRNPTNNNNIHTSDDESSDDESSDDESDIKDTKKNNS